MRAPSDSELALMILTNGGLNQGGEVVKPMNMQNNRTAEIDTGLPDPIATVSVPSPAPEKAAPFRPMVGGMSSSAFDRGLAKSVEYHKAVSGSAADDGFKWTKVRMTRDERNRGNHDQSWASSPTSPGEYKIEHVSDSDHRVHYRPHSNTAGVWQSLSSPDGGTAHKTVDAAKATVKAHSATYAGRR